MDINVNLLDINLLPWRDEQRVSRRYRLISLFIAAFIVALIVTIFLSWIASQKLAHQEARNQLLKQQVNDVSKKNQSMKDVETEKEELVKKIQMLQTVFNSRAQAVRLFIGVSQIIPEGVYLTEMKRADLRVILSGYALSNAQITELMRNIAHSPWFAEPLLNEISESKQAEESGVKKFTVQMVQKMEAAPPNSPAVPQPAQPKDAKSAKKK